jgi:hypothetical protein
MKQICYPTFSYLATVGLFDSMAGKDDFLYGDLVFYRFDICNLSAISCTENYYQINRLVI